MDETFKGEIINENILRTHTKKLLYKLFWHNVSKDFLEKYYT